MNKRGFIESDPYGENNPPVGQGEKPRQTEANKIGWSSIGATDTWSCNCVGPQPGFPKCPCMMRGLIQRDGRWIEPERDLGPVSTAIKQAKEQIT